MGIKVVPEESAGLNPHIKEGIYVGRLAGITEKVLEVKKEGQATEQVPRFELVFGVRTPDADIRFTALTSPKATTKSKLYGWLKALNGGQAAELGKEIDLDTFVGKYANLSVKDKDRKDRTGNIQKTSEIADVIAIDKNPEKEINIEGLVESEDDDEAPAAPPVTQPAPPAEKKKKK